MWMCVYMHVHVHVHDMTSIFVQCLLYIRNTVVSRASTHHMVRAQVVIFVG